MKKILLRVLIIVLAIALAIGIAAYFLLFRDPGSEDVRLTIVDADGATHVAVTDEEGSTHAIIVDDNGDRWEVEVKDDGSLGSTVANVNDKYDVTDVITNYSGPVIDESADPNAFTGNVIEDSTRVTTAPADGSSGSAGKTTTSGGDAGTTSAANSPTSGNSGGSNGGQTTDPVQGTTQSTTTPAQPTTGGTTNPTSIPTTESQGTTEGTTSATDSTSNIIRYQKMFASGTYYMEFTTNDKDIGDTPIVAAAKNGNVLIKTSMEGLDCSMLYLANKDKTYLLIHNYKKYCSVPQSMLGDDFNMSSFNLMESFSKDINESAIKKDKVSINGKTLDRESYTTADGATMRYYFEGGTLVRLDSESSDGNVETYISKVTSDVSDSTFEIPKNYGYLNLSWLDFLS